MLPTDPSSKPSPVGEVPLDGNYVCVRMEHLQSRLVRAAREGSRAHHHQIHFDPTSQDPRLKGSMPIGDHDNKNVPRKFVLVHCGEMT